MYEGCDIPVLCELVEQGLLSAISGVGSTALHCATDNLSGQHTLLSHDTGVGNYAIYLANREAA